MGRIYTVPYQGNVTNAGGDNDLMILLPADDKPIRLRGWILGQFSEVQDAAEEVLRMSVIHMTATVTDGNGTSVPPIKTDQVDAAAGFTAECNATTIATTSGTSTTLQELAWNVRNTPWDHWYPDRDFCPKARQGEALILRLQSTVADDVSVTMTFFVEEE